LSWSREPKPSELPGKLNKTDIRQKPGYAGLFYCRLLCLPDFIFSGLLISWLALFPLTLSYFAASGLRCGHETFDAPYFY
jgi:hypothetical protein